MISALVRHTPVWLVDVVVHLSGMGPSLSTFGFVHEIFPPLMTIWTSGLLVLFGVTSVTPWQWGTDVGIGEVRSECCALPVALAKGRLVAPVPWHFEPVQRFASSDDT